MVAENNNTDLPLLGFCIVFLLGSKYALSLVVNFRVLCSPVLLSVNGPGFLFGLRGFGVVFGKV